MEPQRLLDMGGTGMKCPECKQEGFEMIDYRPMERPMVSVRASKKEAGKFRCSNPDCRHEEVIG